MFVRWKRQTWQPKKKRWDIETPAPVMGVYASLVESERRDGKPRQRVIKYLGGIADRLLPNPLHRGAFWQEAEERLSTLELTPDQMQAIRSSIARRVPLPTEAERSE